MRWVKSADRSKESVFFSTIGACALVVANAIRASMFSDAPMLASQHIPTIASWTLSKWDSRSEASLQIGEACNDFSAWPTVWLDRRGQSNRYGLVNISLTIVE